MLCQLDSLLCGSNKAIIDVQNLKLRFLAKCLETIVLGALASSRPDSADLAAAIRANLSPVYLK
jgi:hypothetical protein